MRLKLTLIQERRKESLPVSTNYYICAAIYRALERSSPEFSGLMHRRGYSSPEGRRKFKLFTFSNLNVPERKIEGTRLISFSKKISLMISSPVEDFLQHLVTGLFLDGYFFIEHARFRKGDIQTLPDPEFSETMEFSMLSPMVVSVMRPDRSKEFLKYNDERLPTVVLKNLLAKYQAIHGHSFEGDVSTFAIRFSEKYLTRRQGKVEKLIKIHEGRAEETHIKAILCPFTITAPIELIKVGYDCGFGEKNSVGFGMVKA
ncbi:MAG: CRISPR-associated endoribonuclease Cas6 [Candidatus Thermochlorobacter aerophilum]|jgi:CRISPR-associated endoribonuclease Cas6|uniref:CRISPR-associated endoribonuclease n=1 Tax=Candidatus Thermochlorobacter aerophilus TaxID=1868324 RepID=A0A395LYQ7_9BACT|nr:MAG: CRISPR-associated endoribonuclease Cas6 [Candidatus Thermochlorobacter aerophilum]